MNSKFGVSKIFLIWYFSIFTIFTLGYFYFPGGEMSSNSLIESLSNWDGKHYLNIAQSGYSQDNNTAFFPLYPLLIKGLALITHNYLFSAIFISGISFLLALNFLYRLIKINYTENVALKTILTLVCFPTSLFFITAYSESLFLLLTLTTFYFLQKEKYIFATLFCLLATATRLAGLALVLALFIEILYVKKLNKKNWMILFAPAGFFVYLFYIYNLTGDPFYFIEVQKSWGRQLSLPWTGFWQSIKIALLAKSFGADYFRFLIDLVFAVFGLGMALRAFRFLPLKYSVYSLFSILIPLFTSKLISMPRFILPIFPVFILIAIIKNEYINYFYFFFSVLLLSIFAVLYINGYWVS